jgi:hypothetical protein
LWVNVVNVHRHVDVDRLCGCGCWRRRGWCSGHVHLVVVVVVHGVRHGHADGHHALALDDDLPIPVMGAIPVMGTVGSR